MSDGYLRVLSVQTYAYVFTVLLVNVVWAVGFAGYWTWGGILLGCIFMGVMFMPFWLVDALFLRPAIYPRSTSPALFIGELAAVLAINIAIHASRELSANGYHLVQIARDTSTESFWLCIVYAFHTLLSYVLSKLEAKSSSGR